MNDDFLHRIRTNPPDAFLTKLKSRLDLQPQPAPTAAARSTLRKILLGLLLSGGVFAITMLMLNWNEPVGVTADTVETRPSVAQTLPAATNSTVHPHNDSPTAAAQSSPRIVDARPTALTAPAFTYMTTKSLEPYVRSRYSSGIRGQTIAAADSTSDALAQFCGTHSPADSAKGPLLFALVTRRMTSAESDACTQHMGKVTETVAGYQAIVLARSKLYGTFSLTPADIFLALAAEIPDPNHPDELIKNNNTVWSDVNSSLEREPIEFFGPEPSSPVGVAFREILFEAGCREMPGLAPPRACPDFRKDGVYAEATPTPFDMLLKLQTKPNAIGILAYGPAFLQVNELTASPIKGVVPTLDTILSDAYPGARSLYLYFNQQSGLARPWGVIPGPIQKSRLNEQFAIIAPNRSQP